MNSVTLIGNLTKDPELKDGKSKVCRMRIAENGRSEEPVYINVAAFGRQAETCGEYLRKGRMVAVTGRLRFREWHGENGKRSEHSIAADRVDFLPSGDGNGARSPERDEEDHD